MKFQSSSMVFAHNNGDRIKDVKRSFKTACTRVGIENFRIHDLRHTCASLAVTEGVSLEALRDLLGHSSVTVTERYAHLAPAKVREAVYCVRDNAVPIWGNVGVVTFESSCRDYCKKYNSMCGDAVRQVTEAEYYRIQACVQGGKSTANCLGIPSDKSFIFGSREAAKQLGELETVAAEAYQRYGLQILTLLSEMDELSSGVVNRQVSLDYAENKLWTYLAKAQVKLRNYNLAVDKFESIQVEVDSDIQAYKRNYYNFLVNIGDTFANMIKDAEEQIYATREDNDDLLSQLWHSSMDRYIFIVEAENSLLEYAQLKITSEHPQTYYLESVIQANSTLAEIYRILQMISSDDSIESIKESLHKAKFALNEMTVAIGKGRGLLADYSNSIEHRVSKEAARAAVDSYSASFGNESDMKLILDEILNYFFSLYETGETGIDNFEQWWSNIALKLELLIDQRLKLQQQRLQISQTMLLE